MEIPPKPTISIDEEREKDIIQLLEGIDFSFDASNVIEEGKRVLVAATPSVDPLRIKEREEHVLYELRGFNERELRLGLLEIYNALRATAYFNNEADVANNIWLRMRAQGGNQYDSKRRGCLMTATGQALLTIMHLSITGRTTEGSWWKRSLRASQSGVLNTADNIHDLFQSSQMQDAIRTWLQEALPRVAEMMLREQKLIPVEQLVTFPDVKELSNSQTGCGLQYNTVLLERVLQATPLISMRLTSEFCRSIYDLSHKQANELAARLTALRDQPFHCVEYFDIEACLRRAGIPSYSTPQLLNTMSREKSTPADLTTLLAFVKYNFTEEFTQTTALGSIIPLLPDRTPVAPYVGVNSGRFIDCMALRGRRWFGPNASERNAVNPLCNILCYAKGG